MASPEDIAKQFVQFYYTTFDTNRPGLAPLYRDSSSLTWEGQVFKGHAGIVEKLGVLPQAVKHQVTTLDAQAASESSIVALVTGALVIDDSPPMQYTQCFHLVPEGGSYFVFNDIFRLCLS